LNCWAKKIYSFSKEIEMFENNMTN
jgi:hypothetical protein